MNRLGTPSGRRTTPEMPRRSVDPGVTVDASIAGPEAIWLIVEGRLEIHDASGGPPLATLGPGDVVHDVEALAARGLVAVPTVPALLVGMPRAREPVTAEPLEAAGRRVIEQVEDRLEFRAFRRAAGILDSSLRAALCCRFIGFCFRSVAASAYGLA